MKKTRFFDIELPELGDRPDITQVSDAIQNLEDTSAGMIEVMDGVINETTLTLTSKSRLVTRTNYYDGMSFKFVAKENIDANRLTSVNVDGLGDQILEVGFFVNRGDSVDIIYGESKFTATLPAFLRVLAGNGLTSNGPTSNVAFNVVSQDEGIIVNPDNIKLNIVDDLYTGGVRRPLSAEQGKVLNTKINAIGTGGISTMMRNSEKMAEPVYTGMLPSGGKTIAVGAKLFNPVLHLNGIRIEENKYSVELTSGTINMIDVYSPEADVVWVVEDTMDYHISFCFPSLGLLISDTGMKARIKLGDVIKILGDSEADDGGHFLVKCENTKKLNGVDIGNGRWLNEIPNTKITKALFHDTKAELLANKDLLIPYEPVIAVDEDRAYFKNEQGGLMPIGGSNNVDSIETLKSSNYNVGDVVQVLGYYEKGDGARHVRKISNTSDVSGILLANGLFANIVNNGEANVKWFGAKGDGTTDDTWAFDLAFSYLPRYSTLKVPDGVFKGNFTFQFHQVYGTGNTTFIAQNNDVPIVILKDPSGWDYQTLRDCKVDGKKEAKICISFGLDYTTRYDGRWLIKNVSINNAVDIGVKKPGGNIGCHWEECDFNDNAIHYYAHNEGTEVMHVGCDTFYKCHLGGATKAVWYYKENGNTGKEEGGQIIIRDCIAEGNNNSAVLIADNFGKGTVPLVVENLWLEQNSKLPTSIVNINGKDYKAREFHIEGVGRMEIKGTYIHSSYFKDSIVKIDSCEISSSYLSQSYEALGEGVQLENINSSILVENCYSRCGWSQVDNDQTPLIVKNLYAENSYIVQGNMGFYSSQPNNLKVSGAGSAEVIYSNKNTTLNDRIVYEGDRIPAKVVKDGVMDSDCLEYSCTVDGGWTHRKLTGLANYIGKTIVMTFSIKPMTTNNLSTFMISAGNGDVGKLNFKKAGKWNHYRLCFVVSSAHTNGDMGFWFNKAPKGFVFRMQNIQILAFDNHSEGVSFMDSGSFLDKYVYDSSRATENFRNIEISNLKERAGINRTFYYKKQLEWIGGSQYGGMQATDYVDEDTKETLKKYRIPELNTYIFRPYIYAPADNGKWALIRTEIKFFNIDKDRTFGFYGGSGNEKSGEFTVYQNDNELWRTYYTLTKLRDDMTTHPFNTGFYFVSLPVGTEFACRCYIITLFDEKIEAEKAMKNNSILIP